MASAYAGCGELERSISQRNNAIPVEEPEPEREAPLPDENSSPTATETLQERKATFVHRGDAP